MSINKWIKNRLLGVAFALSNVEKNAFSQKGEDLDKNINQEQKKDQGTLLNSLINGVVTTEVQNLRWRTYKVLKAAEGLVVNITGYDENDQPITTTRKSNKTKGLNLIKLDSFDAYPLEMVVDNTAIITSGNDVMDNKNINVFDEAVLNHDINGTVTGATHGNISGEEYFATTKGELPITITRNLLPKFEIEKFTKKLNIRRINDKQRLLEFYVSMYPDEFNRTSRLFISDIKKTIINPRNSTILDIKEVYFVTYKTIGVDDFKEYQYKIVSFDKIIEFNGHYVIKFISEVIIDGDDILDDYRMAELDAKYDKKEKKIQTYDNSNNAL